jgi:hypothetical protein
MMRCPPPGCKRILQRNKLLLETAEQIIAEEKAVKEYALGSFFSEISRKFEELRAANNSAVCNAGWSGKGGLADGLEVEVLVAWSA